MTFTARFRTDCPECGEPVRPGDDAVMTDDGAAHAYHDTTTPVRAGRVCPSCNLIHQGECF